MTVQGLGYLLTTNLPVRWDLQRPKPDFVKIGKLIRKYFYVVATQGTMRAATIVIMAKFVTGI